VRVAFRGVKCQIVVIQKFFLRRVIGATIRMGYLNKTGGQQTVGHTLQVD